ncbi:MAG: GAF domain-containing protein [Candidatus Bathyarchaeia archaeon]
MNAMEQELKYACEKLQALLKALPDIIYIKDCERRNIMVNDAYERFVGLRKEEIIGKRDEEILPADLAAQCRASDEKVLKEGDVIRSEEYTIDREGKQRIFETIKAPIYGESGEIIGIIGVSRDITENRLAEKKSQEREELLRSVLENAYTGIAVINENFEIVYANTVLANALGYHKEELAGRDFRTILAEESRAQFTDEALRRFLSEDAPWRKRPITVRNELKVVGKDGKIRDVEVKAKVFSDPYGRMRVVAQAIDVTEKKKLEAERRSFEKKLSELDKYAQKLNMAQSLGEVYNLTLNAIERILGFEYASIFIVEEKNLRMVAQRGYGKLMDLVLPIDGDKGVVVIAARRGEPIIIPDVRKEKAYVEAKEGMLSELAVPMKAGNKVVGVINVESGKLAAFNEGDRKLLEILASHAAIAISNLQKRESIAEVNAYGRSLVNAKSLKEVINLTLNAATKILGFKHVSIMLIEDNKLKLVASRGVDKQVKLELPLNGEKGVTVKAAKSGNTIYIPDVQNEPLYVQGGILDAKSELAVPIKIGNKVLGVLNVESRKSEAFDEDDVKKLEILATYVAIAISNIKRRESLVLLSRRLEYLIRSSAKIMQTPSLRKRLRIIVKAVQKFGWRKVAVCIRDEASEKRILVTAGLTKEEKGLPASKGIPREAWDELLSQEFEAYRMGDFYHIPWNNPWIMKYIYGGKLIQGYDADWMIAPLHTPNGKIIGFISLREPISGKMPTREELIPLELFLRHAAVAIENAKLIEDLKRTSIELENYAEKLEQKVEERTKTILEVQDKLLKAQRLAVIGELAGMVGHDLRNPLTSISAATYYLKKRLTQTDEKIKSMIELIEKNIAYANKIVSDLLDYSRELKLDLTETTPKKLIEESLSLTEIPANIRLINAVKSTIKIVVDQEKMKRVFINLIRNAIDAMPNGGTLTIRCREKGDEVIFTVSDTGIGMNEEVLRNLWSPLFTTKAKGMGFGLPICKRFVEAHGGSISVKSTLGKGTTFTIKVPVTPRIKKEKGGDRLWVEMPESSLSMTMKASEKP